MRAKDCLGSVLAQDLLAAHDVPAFDRSAMDGFAVCGSGPWEVVGDARAGGADAVVLQDGTAVHISTGAAIPAGCTRVVPTEAAVLAPGTFRLTAELTTRDHIRRRREEASAGDVVLPAGVQVSPYVLGLAAAAGVDELVVRLPVPVQILVTGDEIVRSGPPTEGRTRDALGPMLPSLLAAIGGIPTAPQFVSDTTADLVGALRAGREPVVVTTGSSASGRADHLRAVLAAEGARMLISGVACRPGHPMLLAVLGDGRHVVGLPGNPLAAVVGVLTIMEPLLRGLRGADEPTMRMAPLAEPATPRPGDTRLFPAIVSGGSLREVGFVGSAMLRGIAQADALAVLGPGRAEVAAGTMVRYLPLPGR